MSKTIPIKNIYHMLCYAWNVLDKEDIINVEKLDKIELVDLFANVLENGIRQLIKQGCTRVYNPCHDEICGLKGKINFDDSIKYLSYRRGRMYCFFDEFDSNNLHNQIIKTTMVKLVNSDLLDHGIKKNLHDLLEYFHNIDTIDLRMNHFTRVIIHRNNRIYKFLLDVCKLIYTNTMIDEKSGEIKFNDFTRDKGMHKLFEMFVLNFYKKHLDEGYEVKSEIIN